VAGSAALTPNGNLFISRVTSYLKPPFLRVAAFTSCSARMPVMRELHCKPDNYVLISFFLLYDTILFCVSEMTPH